MSQLLQHTHIILSQQLAFLPDQYWKTKHLSIQHDLTWLDQVGKHWHHWRLIVGIDRGDQLQTQYIKRAAAQHTETYPAGSPQHCTKLECKFLLYFCSLPWSVFTMYGMMTTSSQLSTPRASQHYHSQVLNRSHKLSQLSTPQISHYHK